MRKGLRGIRHCSHWLQDLQEHLLHTRTTLPQRPARLHKICNLSLDFIYFSTFPGNFPVLSALFTNLHSKLTLPPSPNKHTFCLFSPLYTHELWSSANKLSATSTSKLLISVEEWQMEESSPASFLATLQPEVWRHSMCPHSSLTWEPLLYLLQRVQNWNMAETKFEKGGRFGKSCLIKMYWNS